MSDIEFDVLDELYFVTWFSDLMETTELGEQELKNCLITLIKKGWVKCYKNIDEEELKDNLDFDNKFCDYAYLATKAGLLAHNSK
ncbi:transporter [Chondrinema litorale]|uniref:transporter n=1 Tax=Chondrinema litorale TaxID=2994555 RepID=UPI00254289E9|nr:transporter [Chondrinema litorale]UZR93421.1 transporter [Chondrinema litorale]